MTNGEIKRIKILGVGVDRVNLAQAVERVTGWLEEEHTGAHYIVTPNPEFIVAAQKDPEFRRILNTADLAIPDGVGLRLSGKVTDIVGGIYLLEELCRVASEKGYTTAFLGGQKNVAKEAAECLQKKFPGLKVVFAEDGPEVDMNGEEVVRGPAGLQPHQTSSLVNLLRALDGAPRSPSPLTIPATDLLFVGFGQVKQEKWIARNLGKLPVRVMMGVGGSFDEIAGRVPQVPHWVFRLGLKWLFRLVTQPWRIKRQLALMQFAWLMLFRR